MFLKPGRVALAAALCWLFAVAAAQAAHPFGVPESGGAGWLPGLFGQAAAWQAQFYRQLTGALRAWQADGGAAWTLIGLSFAYGVFHALGPGHGKAVISSYVLANRQTARNGALLALAASLVQALVAIAVVALLALAFNATAAVMNAATRWLELASYALVTALGAWLVWAKALRPLGARRAADGGDDHDHGRHHGAAHEHHHAHGHSHGAGSIRHHASGRDVLHVHDLHAHGAHCGCGHAHVPPPELAAGPWDWRRAAGAIGAVGLRPCSGALIVLVFALSQGFFAAGVASALAMGLGTGLTVAALACMAAAAGGAANRLGRRLSGRGAARLRYAVEALAALAILLLGLLLLGGALAGGPPW
ncbi:nickel/cobalt transporter [Achromobacter sp. Marseille-Q4962]|uniref:nickel/cobalt transporter n=1 Tax=Achromobacter sp. Marseille-Q4962 TaxID=2942202 RepID=UPI002073CC2D|nr:nickel/cobalt transporter [Achromobacter sp. Marseille-Q4962]